MLVDIINIEAVIENKIEQRSGGNEHCPDRHVGRDARRGQQLRSPARNDSSQGGSADCS